jgi:sugar-specific transcriptional regulator TrmB
LSQEKGLELLKNMGFSAVQATVYLYLAKTGSQKGKDLVEGLEIKKQQLYPILKSLQKEGIIFCSCKRPKVYKALTFDQLLDRHVKTNVGQAQNVLRNKQELLKVWRKMTENNNF